jgi:hypothetical protein
MKMSKLRQILGKISKMPGAKTSTNKLRQKQLWLSLWMKIRQIKMVQKNKKMKI